MCLSSPLFHLLFLLPLFTPSAADSLGDRVVLGPAPPISSSPNLADQLTKNRYRPNEFRAPIPEEITNRLLAAQGITRIENKHIPHPDRNNPNEAFNPAKTAILLGSAQDLSNRPRSSPPAQLVNNRFGEDLTEQTLFSTTKEGGKTSPFGERNRLFTVGKYSEKNGDMDLLETRPSLWSDASELIRKLGESSSPIVKKTENFPTSAITFPSRLLQDESQSQQPQNPYGQVNGAPFGEFLPSFVIDKLKNRDNLRGFSNLLQPNGSYQPLMPVSQSKLYNNMQSTSSAHNYQPVRQMELGGNARKYPTNFGINPMSSLSMDLLPTSKPAVHSAVPPSQPFTEDSRSLSRFDTNLNRFSKEPADELARQRVVLNPLDPAFQTGITVDSFLKRPTNFGKTPTLAVSIRGEAISRQGMVAQGGISPTYEYSQPNYNSGQISPVNNVVVDGPEAAERTVASMPGVITARNPNGAKTTILTNERIPAWEEAPRGSGGGYVFEKAPTSPSPINSNREEEKQFFTYPNYRDPNQLFPVLANHVKEDPRPATGRRNGPQGRFGGGTNEYREDWGQRAPITGINDQRQPGATGGANAWERLPTAPPPPLNQLFGRVAVENLPSGPYPNKGALNALNSRRIVLGGDDLSNTDVAGHVDFGKTVNLEFTTTAPYLYGSVTTTVVGIPLENLDGLVNKSKKGPASSLIGTDFNPIMDRVVVGPLPEEGSKQSGLISQYHGPEEMTRSRYRNFDETRNAINGGTSGRGPNRYVKMELLNE